MSQIVGTTYRAEIFCRRCTRRMANGEAKTGFASMVLALEAWANQAGINLWDESTYDSEDFPKLLKGEQVEPGDRCQCGMLIR